MLEWPDAPDWRLVRRDGVRIMPGKCPHAVPAAGIGSHSWFAYLDTDGVDKLYADLVPTAPSFSSRRSTVLTG